MRNAARQLAALTIVSIAAGEESDARATQRARTSLSARTPAERNDISTERTATIANVDRRNPLKWAAGGMQSCVGRFPAFRRLAMKIPA
jgi:hypothetical protein